MMQSNDAGYITASGSANPFSVSCGHTQQVQSFTTQTSMAMDPQPSQPIDQTGFEEFDLYNEHGHGHDQASHSVQPPKSEGLMTELTRSIDPGKATKQDQGLALRFTTGMPPLETGGYVGEQACAAPTESTALLDWYRQIISGLSEENATLSAQLNEAKREIAQLKAAGDSRAAGEGGLVEHSVSWATLDNPAGPAQFQGVPSQQPLQGAHDGTHVHGRHEGGYEISSAVCAEPHPPHPQMHGKNPFHAGVQRMNSFERVGSDGGVSSSDEVGTDGFKRPCYWTHSEHKRFLEALTMYKGHRKGGAAKSRDGGSGAEHEGKGGKVSVGLGQGIAELIAAHVRTRTVAQVRSHAQKFFLKESKKAKKEQDKRKKREDKDATPVKTEGHVTTHVDTDAAPAGAPAAQDTPGAPEQL